jgi:hypothetical protein
VNERIRELAEQAGYYLYDLTETHQVKTVETDEKDEWITLEKFAELVRADEREACAQVCEENSLMFGDSALIGVCRTNASRIRSRGEE